MKKIHNIAMLALLIVTFVVPLKIFGQDLARIKKRVAVFEFEDKTDHRYRWWSGQSVGQGMSDMLVTELVKTGKYKVIERGALDKLMKEQSLGMTGAVTPESAAKAGKLLGVEIAIVGAVTEFGHSRGGTGGRIKNIRIGVSKQAATVGIDVRLINVETGEILAAEHIRKEKSKKGLSFGTPKFSFDNKNKFDESIVGKATRAAIEDIIKLLDSKSVSMPWQAKIIKVAGNQIYINSGAEAGLKNGDVFVVYAKGEDLVDPDTGLSLGSVDTKIGKIKVVNNNIGQGKASVCIVVQGSGFARGNFVRLK
ncbi:MAG: hypothetical protein GXO74_04610 [Calditrichaeota bacterium]|nr:hypothetical protein [Calditrichota bacterium]